MNDLNFFVSFIEADKAIKRKKYIIAFCVIVFIAFIGGIYYFVDKEERMIINNIAELNEYVTSAEVNAQLMEIRAKNSELTILNNYFHAVKAISLDFENSNIITNEFIVLINSTIPESIVLENINYSDSIISFSGTSANRVEIAEFYYNLLQLDIFSSVYLGSITAFEIIEVDEETEDETVEETIIEGFNFAMQCHLKGGGIK